MIGLPYSERKLLYETWNKGKVDIAPISHADVRYTLKYIDKQIFGARDLFYNYGDFEPPFAHFSKGLGVKWIEKNLDKFDSDGVLRFTDTRQYSLPPYFREKYRFKKVYKPFTDSVKRYAKCHSLTLWEAYQERQKVVELAKQRSDLKYSGTLYNVDNVMKLNL